MVIFDLKIDTNENGELFVMNEVTDEVFLCNDEEQITKLLGQMLYALDFFIRRCDLQSNALSNITSAITQCAEDINALDRAVNLKEDDEGEE